MSGGITPDFTSDWQGNGFPGSAWFAANPTVFPVIVVRNDTSVAHTFALPFAGRGLLVVYGALSVSGSEMWNGVTLVGGTLTSNGNNTIEGAVVTGLNVKLGYTVATNSIGNGTKDFSYNSCNVSSAMAGLGTMRAYKNTWSNTYSVY